MAKAADFDPRVLKLFDGYVHGTVSRRQFIDQAAAFNDTTPRFDEETAALAWQRTVEHFNTHLKTGAP